MKIRHFFSSMLIATICLSLVTGTANAQQPNAPSLEDATVQDEPEADPGAVEPLILRPSQDDTVRRPFESPQDQDAEDQELIMVNAKYAGWQEVTLSPEGDRLVDNLRGNWIMVDPNGRFEGRVSPSEGADTDGMNIFLMNMGRLVKQTSVDANGRFDFNNVRQGAYSLIGWGPNGFFAFGMNILAHNPNNRGVVTNTMNITAYQNQTTINTDWIKFFAPQVSFRVYGRYESGEGRDDPAALYGFKGLVENLPESTLATSISSRPVAKTDDGRLVGRVHQVNSISGRPVDVRSTRVMLFQGDAVVASTTTDNYGAFEFDQVVDGAYGLSAVGTDGVGLIAIEVGGEAAPGAGSTVDFTMVSSETIGWLNNYASEVAYRRALLTPRPPVANQNPYGCQNCNNQGCAQCRKNCCDSRGISFEQWAQSGCNCNAHKLGDGSVLAAWTKQVRKYVQKSDDIYSKAFFPEQEGFGNLANDPNQQQPGYANPGYQQGYPQQGYPQQGYPQAYPAQPFYGN